MVDLSEVRKEILIERYEEISKKYANFGEKLEEFLKEFASIKNEIKILSDELIKRGLDLNELNQ